MRFFAIATGVDISASGDDYSVQSVEQGFDIIALG